MLKQVSFVFFLLYSCCMGAEFQLRKHLTRELRVKVPTEEVWKVYRNLEVVEHAAREHKDVIRSLDVRGNGGDGTFTEYIFVQGTNLYTERFTKIADEKRTKVAERLGGGCLAVGCEHQTAQFDLIEETNASCVIKSDIKYIVKKEFEADDVKPDIQSVAAFAETTKKSLESKSLLNHR
ncbi:S-norcoclaurine synthase-like [Herrania umbratica]|uniref:S-norcoclaurine synthase-like n=1 Tax=Herrania umbratica TaxID=108875 RepID=A0A6J1AJI5_9ROSI|nr:S-norcoclaurine synthase-like [Herrania umbratica]